jgi:hypothetical protein
MSRERRAGRKALIIGIVVLLLTAFFAYYLHLRPAEEAAEPDAAGVERTEPPPRPASPSE